MKRGIWLLILTPFTIFAFNNCSSSTSSSNPATSVPASQQKPVRIVFPGIGSHGIGDPSLAQDGLSARVWMSYSSVDPSVLWPTQNPNVEATRLAYSDNQGSSWTDTGTVVTPIRDVTLPFASPANAGTWVSEVSQLLYDPGALAGQHYKLIWHHYLVIAGTGHFEDGWFGMKMADSPLGLASATEIKLFAGSGYDTNNDNINWPTSPPVGGPPQVNLSSAFSALSGCQAFTEPGLYATNSAIYFSASCEQASDTVVVLFKCSSPCNVSSSSSWSFVGSLLNKASAAAAGFDSGFTASGIFQGSDGNVYFTVTPQQTSGAPWADYYKGCSVFKFTNLDAGSFQTSPAAQIAGASGSFNGACAYNQAAAKSGMLYLQVNTTVLDAFQIFASGTNF